MGPVTGFSRQSGALMCDGVSLAEVANDRGTPVHVYSAAAIETRYRAFDAAFGGYPHRLHYALKANSTLAVVRLIRSLGSGVDVNSGGEIDVALRAGYRPDQMVFTGVGKTAVELERAVTLGLSAINAESPGEVRRIESLARAHQTRARIAIRINPDIDADSHPHISTGHAATKFGMSIADARALVADIVSRPNLQLVGLHAHIGSQITKPEPITGAAAALASFARELAQRGVSLHHLDLGGGLGIAYQPDQPVLSAADYAALVLPAIAPSGLLLVLEPGRWIVAPAGVLLTRVVDLKRRPDGAWFVIVDAGMTDLLRPALYGAFHAIEPVNPRTGPPIRADIVGPVCETTDTLGAGRELPPVEVGDLLAIRDTGAYAAVMASNYNRRPTAAEVMVDAGRATVVRRRQTIDDMLQWDE